MGVIKVGTASWADQLLLRSGWYPRSVNTPAGRLGYRNAGQCSGLQAGGEGPP